MKKIILSIFYFLLIGLSNVNAQAFGCTNTDPCNLICNPLLEETGPGDCAEEVTRIFEGDKFECVPGWRNLYGSIDHADFDANANVDFDFSGHPGNDFGSLMIAAYTLPEGYITEGVGAPFAMASNTDYLLTFSVADAIVANPVGAQLAPSEGIDVLLGNHDLITAISPSVASVEFNYSINDFLGSQGGLEFRSDAISIYQDENIGTSWTQKVTCFTTGATNHNLLFFENFRPVLPTTTGEKVFYIKIDQIELIEDRFINNTAGIPTTSQVQCGSNLTVGTELCTVTGMEYQIWDITDPTNEFQLTDNTLTDAYSVNSLNGALANLSNVTENVNLQIRRVFLPSSGVPVENDNCDASLDISITAVNCCIADPWPRIYEGPSYLAPTNLGIEFDGFGNVYVLRANNRNNSPYSISSMDLLKYCKDGELLWTTPLEQTLLSGWRPNTRLAVDNSGQAYVLSMYQNTMSAGGVSISNPGHNLVILKFDQNGELLADRSISYPDNIWSNEFESIKVNQNGSRLFVLLNGRIKMISPVTLGDIFDREGNFQSIDINAEGSNIFFLSENQIGAFIGSLAAAPITTNLVGVPSSKTDFEFDEINKRFYVVVKDFRLYVYRLTNNAIIPQLTIPQCIKDAHYNEIHPVPNGVLVYNPSVGGSNGYNGPVGITFYNLGGGIEWNLPIEGYTTMRTPNMLNVDGEFAYLGANWYKSLNMGWYNTSFASGSFVSRINMTTGVFGLVGDTPSSSDTEWFFENAYSSNSQNTLDNQFNSKLSVFPNPATNNITLDYQGDVDAEYNVEIYDTAGRVIYKESGDNWLDRKTIPLNETNGLYLVRLSVGGKEYIEKFMIKR